MRSSVSAADLAALAAAVRVGIAPYAPAPAEMLTAGTLMWPWEHCHRVLREWRAWALAAPEDVSSVARVVRAPNIAGIAPSLRGRSLVVVDVAIAAAPAADLLAPLRRLDPEVDTVAGVTAAELLARHAPPDGACAIGEQLHLRELPPEALDALVAAAGPGSGSELVAVELRHLGGGEFALAAIGVATGDEEAERVRIGLGQLARRLAPWTTLRG